MYDDVCPVLGVLSVPNKLEILLLPIRFFSFSERLLLSIFSLFFKIFLIFLSVFLSFLLLLFLSGQMANVLSAL